MGVTSNYPFGDVLRGFRKRETMSQQELARKLGVNRNTIIAWEHGDYLPKTQTQVWELANVLHLDEEEAGKLFEASLRKPSTKPLWNVPHERNPFFTGREKILKDLHDTLKKDKVAALTQIQAISGLGGIGKTQVAIEYSYRYRNKYAAVFWFRANTEVALRTSFIEIAKLLDLPEQNVQSPEDLVQIVRAWLKNANDLLLIFDDADTLDVLDAYRPRNSTGHILLTSRAQVFDTLGISKPFELMEMLPEEALAFLFKRTGRDDIDAIEKKAAVDLVKELGYLPLALEQAGAYITTNKARFQDYLASYHSHHLAVLNKSQPKTGDYPYTVATTWAINFRQVEKQPVAADLLRVSAFFSPDSIPLDLIAGGASQLSPLLSSILAPAAEVPIVLNETLEPLTRYSLIHRDIDAHSYSIHRMVQEVMKDKMDEDTRRLWAERSMRAVNEVFPDVTSETWIRCQRLLSQAQVATSLILQYSFSFLEAMRLLQQVGSYLLNYTSQYPEAEQLLQRSLTICEQLLGPEDFNNAKILSKLGRLYILQGKYKQAEVLLKQALPIFEQVLKPTHPDVINIINDLATVYRLQDKYDPAESLYKRALSICEETFGPNHNQTAEILNSLALLYWSQGLCERGIPLSKRALSICEQVLGADHFDTATVLNNLALLYRLQGQYEQAEPLYQRALILGEKTMGNVHPYIAETLINLATLYRDLGKYEQAEPLYQRALTICNKVLGTNHHTTAHIFRGLANIYREQGKYEQAEPLYQRALAIFEQALGSEHFNTAKALSDMARLYHYQKKYEQAELLYQRSLAIYEQKRKLLHPYTAQSFTHLAMLYHEQGKYERAKPLYQRALLIYEEQEGPRHPNIVKTLLHFAKLLRETNREDEAVTLELQAKQFEQK